MIPAHRRVAEQPRAAVTTVLSDDSRKEALAQLKSSAEPTEGDNPTPQPETGAAPDRNKVRPQVEAATEADPAPVSPPARSKR